MDHSAGAGVHTEALKGLCQALGVTPQLSPHLRIVVGGILIQKRDGGILVRLLRLGQLLLHRSGHLLSGVLHLLRRDGRLGRFTGLSHRGGGSRRCRWGSNGSGGGHGGGFLRRLTPQHLIRGADGAALTGEEGLLLLGGKGGSLRPGLRLLGGWLVVQGDIDGGTAAGPLLRRFLLLTDGGCFLRDVLPLRLPALLRPADGVLGGEVQRQTQGRQQHEEEQDQRQHLAEYGGEAHGQTAGQGAAALQGPAGEPQLPQAGEARLIGAGAQQQMQKMNVQANNIANVNTCGFKAEKPAFQALMYGMVNGIGGDQLPKGSGTRMVSTATDFSQAPVEETGRKQDYAIAGDGFFALFDPSKNEISFTRDGSFAAAGFQEQDEEGEWHEVYYLTDGAGRQVLNSSGYPIQMENFEEEQPVGVFIVQYQDGLQHLDGGRFLATEKSGNVWMGSSAVRQGFLETSNTDLATEIGKVIEAQRSYSYALKMMITADEVETTVNNLANG